MRPVSDDTLPAPSTASPATSSLETFGCNECVCIFFNFLLAAMALSSICILQERPMPGSSAVGAMILSCTQCMFLFFCVVVW